jgi:hypothetical protein
VQTVPDFLNDKISGTLDMHFIEKDEMISRPSFLNFFGVGNGQ